MTFSRNPWRNRFLWLGYAVAAHIGLIAACLAMPAAPSSRVEIMAVSILPMAPPEPTSTPAVAQPVKPVTPKKRLSEPAAISHPAVATPNNQPPSPAPPVANATPTESAPVFIAAHDAAYLNNPRPVYPAMSRRLGEQGKVMLEVHVLADGTAQRVSLAKSSGYPRLDEAALEAVRRWQFVPAKQGKENVAQVVTIPMPFVLEK